MPDDGGMNRVVLAEFLKSRRDALQPADVGLAPGARRRVSGLRRDEVAGLAGMSGDYYTRLEQGRGPQPSDQMLGALARALRLTHDERDYLFRLAGRNPPPRACLNVHVAPALLRVLDRLDDTPALVLSALGETLAQNSLAKALLGDHSRFTSSARSSVYRWFTDPAERALYPAAEQARQGRAQVAGLRVAVAQSLRARELVERLRQLSPEFHDIWQDHDVATRFADHKTLLHPELGEIELDCQTLYSEDQSQALLVLTAAPGSGAAEKLELLAVLGHQRFAAAQ